MAEKLGTVRQDPDLHGLLFTLISRATGGRQERAARLGHMYVTGEGRGLSIVCYHIPSCVHGPYCVRLV